MSEVRRLQNVELSNDAMMSQPDNLELKVRLAETLLRDGHSEDGVRILKAALDQSPNYAPAHLALAAYYEKQGESQLAEHHRRLAGKSP